MSQFLWAQKNNFGPRPRCEHAMAFDSERNRTILFGGNLLAQGLLNDTWEWDGKNWMQINDMGPAPRSRHAMAYDSVRKKIILFGGDTGDTLSNDTWEWNGEFWVQVANTGPTPRIGHTVVFDNDRNKIVLFGGELQNAELLGDTWEWDGTIWIQKEDAGPSSRKGHVMVYDSARKEVVLFGGQDGASALSDTWKWDGTKWMEITRFGADPCFQASMVFTGNTSTLFGGHDANKIVFGNTWGWNGKQWTQKQDIGPAQRWGHSMVYDSDRTTIILFGGLSNFTKNETSHPLQLLGDTWELFKEEELVSDGPEGTSDVIVSTIASFPSYQLRDIAVASDDNIYLTMIGAQRDGIPNQVLRLKATGESSAYKFWQFEPSGIVVDAENNIYVSAPADTIYAPQETNLVKKITSTGEISTFAGSGESGSADGTGTDAQFNNPKELAIDYSGNIYVTDTGNHCSRRITKSGIVNKVAEISSGIAFDKENKMYRAVNNQVQKITLQDGDLIEFAETVIVAGSETKGFADGPALSAQFADPSGVALDSKGNIYVADSGNNRIRKIDVSGQVTTIAGTGEPGIADGRADVAQFTSPSKIACDSKGNIYVLDETNRCLRKITVA